MIFMMTTQDEIAPVTLPNEGLQATANSLRSCVASAIGGA